MKYILSFFCFLILQACGPMYSNELSDSTTSDDPYMPSKPGSCYAKCLMPDLYEEEFTYYLRYTGNDPDQEGIKKRTIVIGEASTKWEKKKADRNCLSANPEDCLVWCLVEVPALTSRIFEVVDTVKIKDFVPDTYQHQYLSEEGGFTDWKEIVCAEDVTPELCKSIQQRLADMSYLEEKDVDGLLGATTKAALVKFQKENQLPIGALDFETLDVLGVKY